MLCSHFNLTSATAALPRLLVAFQNHGDRHLNTVVAPGGTSSKLYDLNGAKKKKKRDRFMSSKQVASSSRQVPRAIFPRQQGTHIQSNNLDLLYPEK